MKKLLSLVLALAMALSLSVTAFAADIDQGTMDAAQLDPGYAVKVELSASGTLKNQADTNKTIAYTIKDGNGAFTSAE